MDEEPPTVGDLSALEIQQLYFDNLRGCDWVRYEKRNHGLLRRNIAFALFGAPTLEENAGDKVLVGYSEKQAELVQDIYKKIHEQKKYSLNDEDIVMSALLVICCKPTPHKSMVQPKDYWDDLASKRSSDIISWFTAVFRVRKCLPIHGGSGCRVYVDENARVYQSWDSYLKNNTLPECVLVVPMNGEYRGVPHKQERVLAVQLSVVPSPSLGVGSRAVRAIDRTSSVFSAGATCVMVTAMVTPVAPAVLAGAAAVGVINGVYRLTRSGYQLRDRRMYEQRMDLGNAEARACYLDILSSGTSLAAGASRLLLARSASDGTNDTTMGSVLVVTVDVLRYGNLIVSFGGLVNSFNHLFQRYRRGERLTTLEMAQFTAAILFFANAVISNRTAQSIIEEAQAESINEYRSAIEDGDRRLFDEAVNVARSTSGTVQGNTDIIKGIRLINDQREYFSNIISNGNVGHRSLTIPVGSDGSVDLDARYNDGSHTSYGMVGLFFRSIWTDFTQDVRGRFVNINPGELLRIGEMVYRITTAGAECIAEILEQLSALAYEQLLLVCCNLLKCIPYQILVYIKKVFPNEDIIAFVVEFVFKYIKGLCGAESGKEDVFTEALKDFFRDGRVKKRRILEMYEALKEMCSRERSRYRAKIEVVCCKCDGIYYE